MTSGLPSSSSDTMVTGQVTGLASGLAGLESKPTTALNFPLPLAAPVRFAPGGPLLPPLPLAFFAFEGAFLAGDEGPFLDPKEGFLSLPSFLPISQGLLLLLLPPEPGLAPLDCLAACVTAIATAFSYCFRLRFNTNLMQKTKRSTRLDT